MKTEATDIDREAASLFDAEPGMRVFHDLCGFGRVLTHVSDEYYMVHWDKQPGAEARIIAFDTDDPATVGVMLAQIEYEVVGDGVAVTDVMISHPGDAVRSYAIGIDRLNGERDTETGPTRGAALVAVMRKLRG